MYRKRHTRVPDAWAQNVIASTYSASDAKPNVIYTQGRTLNKSPTMRDHQLECASVPFYQNQDILFLDASARISVRGSVRPSVGQSSSPSALLSVTPP